MILAVSSATAPVWFPPVFFAGIAIIWCGLCGLQSIFGGWHRLAKVYARAGETDRKMMFQASMSIGTGALLMHYFGLWFRVGPEGLELTMFPVFRFLHRPLMIPWRAIRCTREDFLSAKCTAVHISGPHSRLIFAGDAGLYIYDYWADAAELEVSKDGVAVLTTAGIRG